MVPNLRPAGKSFKWLAYYLSHDPQAQSTERVAWTHTLNLANDTVPEAINEMLWTYRAADWLKHQAGIPMGGRRLENPVKHYSLNWHSSEQPSREHMIETVQSFMNHMGWDEHQAIIFCHTDKHSHVHVMLNAVHPETGRALDTGFEKRRASEWALAYEREHEHIFCAQRLLPKEEREPSPTREAWQKMKSAEREFERDEARRATQQPDYFQRHDPATWQAKEWEALRTHQREEREKFFADGKQAFKEVRNSVYRDVRTEFREEWKTWYQMRREGADPELLATIKAGILERQNTELETRRDAACAELRDDRNADYRQILLEQRMERADLRSRQEQGLRSPQLLDAAYVPGRDPSGRETEGRESGEGREESTENPSKKFREAADETCQPVPEDSAERREHNEPHLYESPTHGAGKLAGGGLDALGGIGMGMLGAIAELGERLFDGFLGGTPKSSPRKPNQTDQPKPIGQQDKRAKATEGQIRAAESRAAEAEELERYWRERERRRGRDRD
jgi:Relaxase/Mobilisation nuclease domain